MSEIVDELLEEVEQLESATKELESSVETVRTQEKQLESAQKQADSEVHLIALQTAKTAQEAAHESQKAAEASIKQVELLKAEMLELNDSNFNWRQSVRNAAKDFKSAKSSMSIMLTTSIIFSLIVLGAAGYLFYATQKQQAKYQGEVLDILSTENTLLKKHITLKIDELASMIENMNLPTHHADSVISHDETIPATDVPEVIHAEDHNKEHTEETATVETAKNQQHEKAEKLVVAENSEPASEEILQHQETLLASVKWLQEHTLTHKELDALEAAINELKTSMTENVGKQPSASALTDAQVKKIDGISWLVRKQSKTIQSLEEKIAQLKVAKPDTDTATIQTMKAELMDVKKHQLQMKAQLTEIQKTIDLLTELSKEPPPYSYRAK